MLRASYRTYATEANALRRLKVLQAKWPDRLWDIRLAPDRSFRYAVVVFIEPNHWAFVS